MAVDLGLYFEQFLREISIGPPQTDRMEGTANTIADFLTIRYGLASGAVFLQGSYPNGTAVEPVEGGEYDVDLVAICADASETANQALDRLEATFKADGRFATRLVRKKPCIRLEYAPDDVGKFHVDVVPARYNASPSLAPLQVPRRDDGWHGSDPAAYTQWCLRQGDAYARTVKVMKRWRSHQQSVRTAIKSIVLQVLVAECMPFGLDDATRVGGTIQALHEHLKDLIAPPHVWNPVLQEEDLAARWTVESFTNFKRELAEANALVGEAVATDDLVEAADAWRELLGDDFPQPGPGQLGLVLGDTSHEQSFAARGWRFAPDPAYAISIAATEQRGTKSRPREYMSGGPAIFAGHKIRFKAATRSPYRSEIWWQVTNTGSHAAQVTNGLRGQFLEAKSITNGKSNDSSIHWESTSYTGAHRVRALLVRQNTVVAVSPYIEVNIWSKNWRHGR